MDTEANYRMTGQQSRFGVLDAWRGLSACLVALFHLQANSHFFSLGFLRHSYLFVDFFFVLSGFVITANYRARILSGFSFWHFMLLRLGRVYPLHFAILVVFILLELARYRFSGLFGGEIADKFSGAHSIEAIITNALLIHSLDVHNMLTWNLPSWSISAEFYTYAIFAIVLLTLRRWTYFFVAFIFVAAPLFLLRFVGHIDTQYDFAIVRSALGFFVGFACYDVYALIKQRARLHDRMSAIMISTVEIFCLCLVILFVCFCSEGSVSLVAPWVFGLTVLVFSFEGGIVSKILGATPFVLLGALSYSIYMVHHLVQLDMQYVLQLIARESGVELFRNGLIGVELWHGDIAYIVMLGLVVCTSCLTYKFIEEPGRRQSRRILSRFFSTPKSAELSKPEDAQWNDENKARSPAKSFACS